MLEKIFSSGKSGGIDFNRRSFLKFSSLLAVFLAACRAGYKEQGTPEIPLGDIIANPDRYKDVINLTTSGYVEREDDEVLRVINPRNIDTPSGTPQPQLDVHSVEVPLYTLRTGQEGSPSIRFTMYSVTHTPEELASAEPNTILPNRYQLMGKMEVITREENGKTIREYILAPTFVKQIDSSTPPPAN